MSVKKSKLDLLVRVRYSNPIPPPPCPPKLLDIPTNPKRYARPEFLDAIADDTPLPMIVDADCGMPLDLSLYECLWQDGPNVDDSSLNPDSEYIPKLDTKDLLLLDDVGGSASTYQNGNVGPSGGPSAPSTSHVSWLRKTEYISRESVAKVHSQDTKSQMLAPVDISREAQLRDVEESFISSNDNFSLSDLKHPNKSDVTAVESYEILPDVDIWANQYDLFRFAERPGERPVDVDDPRLDCALLRPIRSGHETFLAYYLTQNDEAAEKFKQVRSSVNPYDVAADEEETIFNFVRDYETVKVEQQVPNEFNLVIDEGPSDVKPDTNGVNGKPSRRTKGAYYKNIERKMLLKKKRAFTGTDQYEDKWEVVRVQHTTMSPEEQEERDDALAEVTNPEYLTLMSMRDAEGEVDAEAFGDAGELNGNVGGAMAGADAMAIDI